MSHYLASMYRRVSGSVFALRFLNFQNSISDSWNRQTLYCFRLNFFISKTSMFSLRERFKSVCLQRISKSNLFILITEFQNICHGTKSNRYFIVYILIIHKTWMCFYFKKFIWIYLIVLLAGFKFSFWILF